MDFSGTNVYLLKSQWQLLSKTTLDPTDFLLYRMNDYFIVYVSQKKESHKGLEWYTAE